MYLLDTDHISLMDRGTTEGQNIRARLSRVPPDDISAGVISYEEQIRGWVSLIAQARTVTRQIPFYREHAAITVRRESRRIRASSTG